MQPDPGFCRTQEKGIVNPLAHHGDMYHMNARPHDTKFFGSHGSAESDGIHRGALVMAGLVPGLGP
jgi:hypothetical protein